MATEKDVNVKISGDASQAKQTITSFKQNMDEASKSAQKLQTNFKLILSNLIGIGKQVAIATSYTDNYIASQNVLRQTFGESTKGINEYANTLSYMTGISLTDISNKSALFGQMATSLGMANDQASEFVITLDDMASKLALLYNKDFNTMAKAMLDAVKGESSTLATLTGNVLKTGALQATLDKFGIDLVASELTGVNKALLEYITIANQTTATNKDLQKVVNGVAWQKQLLKSQVKELSFAIGNLLYPVLQAILPVFNAILITVTTLLKALASVFGITNSLTSSVQGNANAYNDLGASIEGASNKAKRGLRSFDKLNNITTPTPSSSSGGGGVGINPQLLAEFEKLKEKMLDIRNKAQEISDKILEWLGFTKLENGQLKWQGTKLLKNIYTWWYNLTLLGKILVGLGLVAVALKLYSALKKIVSIVKATRLGAVISLVAEKFTGSKGIVAGVKALYKDLNLAYPILTKVVGTLIGLIEITQGLKNIHESLNSIAKDGTNIYNVTQLIIGAMEILSGMALIVGVLTGNIPLLIGGIVGTLASVAGEIGNSKNKVQELSDTLDFGNETIKTYNENINKLKGSIKESTAEIYAKTGRAQELAKEIDNLYDSNGNFIGSEEELSEKVNALNNLLGTNYTITKDGTIAIENRIIANGHLSDTIKEYCKQLRIQAELEAYYDLYVERAKKKIELEKEIKAKTDELTKSQKDYDMTTEEGVKKFLIDNADKIKDLNKMQNELEKNEHAMSEYEKASYEASIGHYDIASELLRGTSSAMKVSMDKTTKELINNLNKIPASVKENMSKIDNITATIKINADTKEFYKTYNQVLRDTQKIQPYTGNGINITTRANGGFVNQGDLFIANEAGAEWVGSMNGKTAVANNDQIVAGIESGVANGMRKALNSVNLKNNNPIYVKAQFGGEEITDWVQVKANERERQYGF